MDVTLDFRGRTDSSIPALGSSFLSTSSTGKINPTILVDASQEAAWKADENWGQYPINP